MIRSYRPAPLRPLVLVNTANVTAGCVVACQSWRASSSPKPCTFAKANFDNASPSLVNWSANCSAHLELQPNATSACLQSTSRYPSLGLVVFSHNDVQSRGHWDRVIFNRPWTVVTGLTLSHIVLDSPNLKSATVISRFVRIHPSLTRARYLAALF